MVRNQLANAGEVRDVNLIPGSGGFLGGWYGNPLLYSCLKNPMGRQAWWAMVHRDAKNRTQLKQLSMHARMGTYVVFSCISQMLFLLHVRKYTFSLLAFRHGNMINSLQRKVRGGDICFF